MRKTKPIWLVGITAILLLSGLSLFVFVRAQQDKEQPEKLRLRHLELKSEAQKLAKEGYDISELTTLNHQILKAIKAGEKKPESAGPKTGIPPSIPTLKSGILMATQIDKPKASTLTDQDLSDLASKYHLISDRMTDFSSEQIKILHKLNPDIKVIRYIHPLAIIAPGTFLSMSEKRKLLEEHPEWALKDESGNPITGLALPGVAGSKDILMDPANPGWQEYIAEQCYKATKEMGYDGIMMDVIQMANRLPPSFSGINPKTKKVYIITEWRDAQYELLKAVKEKIGKDKLLIANNVLWGTLYFRARAGRFLEIVDGVVAEQFRGSTDWSLDMFLSEEDWLKNVEMLYEVQSKGKYIVANLGYSKKIVTDENKKSQYDLFILCTFLLGKGDLIYFSHVVMEPTYMAFGSQSEYNPIWKTDIGKPLSTYYKKDGIYQRDFEKARVLVNPSNKTFIINLEKNYKPLDGEIVSTLTMQPHTGTILLKDMGSAKDPKRGAITSEVIGIPLATAVYNTRLSDEEWRQIAARYSVVVALFSPTARGQDLSKENERVKWIKSLNPNLKVLVYGSAINAANVPMPSARKAQLENWVLRDEAGELVMDWEFKDAPVFDPGNAQWQDCVANTLKDYITRYGYDGAFLDLTESTTRYVNFKKQHKSINPRTKKPYTDAEWKKDNLEMLRKIRQKIGQDKILIINGSRGQNYFKTGYSDFFEFADGMTNEGFTGWYTRSPIIFGPEEDWKADVDALVDCARRGKIAGAVGSVKKPEPGEEKQTEQVYQYIGTSFLLGMGKDHHLLLRIKTPGRPTRPDEMVLPSFCNVSLGKPKDEYYKKDGLYQRDFERGKVFVNPTFHQVKVNLQGKWRTDKGDPVHSSLLIPAHTGTILLRQIKKGE